MMRGAELGWGYVKGMGRVRVFQDIDNTKWLIVLDRSDQFRSVERSRVIFTKR